MKVKTMDGTLHTGGVVIDRGNHVKVMRADKTALLETETFIPWHNVAELIEETELPDDRDYVQVVFTRNRPKRPFKYTYIDPGLGLQVGDTVRVDTIYKDDAEAEVVSLERGNYDGPLKAISALTARA